MDREMLVVSVINTVDESWELSPIRNLTFKDDCRAVSSIHVGDSRRDNRFIWPADIRGIYSVRSGYRWLRNNNGIRRNS